VTEFEAEFSESVDEIVEILASDKLLPIWRELNDYFLTIYKSFDHSHQLIQEVGLCQLLSKKLTNKGWKLVHSPFSPTIESSFNWWMLHKDGRKLEIVLGDPYDGENPDIVVTDQQQFVSPANKVITVSPELFGLYKNVIEYEYNNSVPKFLFNCFMSGASQSRQFCFYELVKQNLINRGLVSYLLNSRTSRHSTIEEKRQQYDLMKKSEYDIEHTMMRDYVPLKNFKTTLEQAIVDSKISIVIETLNGANATTDNVEIFFTEKTFRALLMPRPFCLYFSNNNVGGVSILKKAGFDVYDDLVDHAYDLIQDPVLRFQTLLEQVKKFEQIEYTDSMLAEFESRAAHNMQLVQQYRAQLPSKFYNVLQQIDCIV